MIIYKISDAIVFNALKSINSGIMEITKFDGSILELGNKNDELKTKVRFSREEILEVAPNLFIIYFLE